MNALTLLVALLVIPIVWALGRLAVARVLRLPLIRVSLGFGGRVAGFHHRGVEYRVGHILLGAYVKVPSNREDLEPRPPDDPRAADPTPATLGVLPAIWKRLLLVPAGPLSVLGFGLILLFVFFLLTLPDALPPAIVGEVLPRSAADQAGLRADDRVLSVDGTAIRWWSELADAVADRPGRRARLRVRRGAAEITIQVVPTATERDGRVVGMLGVSLSSRAPEEPIDDRFGAAARSTAHGIRTFFESTGSYLAGRVPPGAAAGPVAISRRAEQRLSPPGWQVLLFRLGIWCVTVALLSALPLPPFAAGEVVLLGIEAASRRPLPARVRVLSAAVGASILVAIVIMAIVRDVLRALG